MNDETRLTLELEQAHKRLRQARDNLRLARHEHSLAVAEVNMLDARLVRVRYGNMPIMERLPRIGSGRPKTEADKRKLKIYKRIVYLELTARRADSILLPLFNAGNPKKSLAFKLGQEIGKGYHAIKKAYYEGRELTDEVLQL